MKYFRVEKEIMRGSTLRYEIYADQSEASSEHECDEVVEICLGFHVYEISEEGYTLGVEFYPVCVDMQDFTDNSSEVIEQIKRDYPASDWNNNDW